MAEELAVEIRESRGKLNNRRLRRAGSVPAVLYGHGLENVSLSVSSEQLDSAVQRGSRLINLTGAVNEPAFVREVQWDTWGVHVLHVDFTRISEDETVEVQIKLELRGEAPGVRAGGTVTQLIHAVQVECPAMAIPEKISININGLNLDETITLADLELPEGATILDDPESVVVNCITITEQEEETDEAAPHEPEVIGAKPEEKTEEN